MADLIVIDGGKDNIGNDITLLINASFTITERYGIRLHYQQGLSEVGEYIPMILDDPNTPVTDTQDITTQSGYAGDEARAGMKGFENNIFGASLLIRF